MTVEESINNNKAAFAGTSADYYADSHSHFGKTEK